MGDATREGRGKQRLETLWKKFESTLQLHPCVLCILFFFLAIIQISWRFACLSRSMLRRCIFIMWVEKEKKRMTVRHIKLKGIDIFIESFLEIIEIVESSSSISKWTDVKQGNELS